MRAAKNILLLAAVTAVFPVLLAFVTANLSLVLLLGTFFSVLSVGLGFGTALLLRLTAPFRALFTYDPVLALIALGLVFYGLLDARALGLYVAQLGALQQAAEIATAQLMLEFAERCNSQAWGDWRRRHRWRTFGFGLPLTVVCHFYPGAVVWVACAFNWLAAASGVLVADAASAERLEGAAMERPNRRMKEE